MKRFSIILPVRNGGVYVKECVNSILNQSLQDFDLLVLDNKSTDGTTEWLNGLNDPRIKLFPSERSLSIEENWARIVSVPKNEFITMIGHDDLLSPDYLAVMDSLIRLYPEATLYQAHFQLIDSKGARIRACKPMKEKEDAASFLQSVLTGKFDVYGTGFMMRSTDYDKLGGIPDYPNLLFADFELWMELTRHSYKATASEECFSYRLHMSMTKLSADAKLHLAFDRFVTYLVKLKTEDRVLKAVIDEYGLPFLASYCKGMSHRLLRTPIKNRNGLSVSAFLNDCRQNANTLLPGNTYDPGSDKSVRLAKFIDSNSLTRTLFQWFRKLYARPILK
jgi:glycosyltransferase involved in cell wall biosynthesis